MNPWQMRDPAVRDKPRKEPINTFGLGDNCYYVTTARLLNTTVEKLFERTGEMQIADGAKVEEIEGLLRSTGQPYELHECPDLETAVQLAEKHSGACEREFGLAYGWRDPVDPQKVHGHVVVLRWDPDGQDATYIDYQVDPEGADAAAEVNRSTRVYLCFYLFWF